MFLRARPGSNRHHLCPIPLAEVVDGTVTLQGGCWAVPFTVCPGEGMASQPHLGYNTGVVPVYCVYVV